MRSDFVKADTKLISKIKSVEKDEIKRRNSRFDHEIYNTKHLTQCPRRMSYRFNAEKTDLESDFLVDNAKYIKNKWIDFFSDSKGVFLKDKNVIAADCNYNLFGIADAILQIDDIVFVLLVEPLSNEEYAKSLSNDGLRNHIVNLMMLMWLTEVNNGILLCENIITQDHMFLHVVPYKPIIESARNKCADLMSKNMLQIIPDRPYKDSDNEECNVCEYSNTCWIKEKNNDK